MGNVVALGSSRPKPRRTLGVPRSGARILFFTGVRYCRDETSFPIVSEPLGPHDQGRVDSGLVFDRAAH